jgi:hypothetical protein
MQAKLPEHLQEHTIQKMVVGEAGWTVPWAMWADTQGALWIHGGYTVHEHAGGTVWLHILRTAEGIIVDVSRCLGYSWHVGQPLFVGEVVAMPVIALHGVEGQ